MCSILYAMNFDKHFRTIVKSPSTYKNVPLDFQVKPDQPVKLYTSIEPAMRVSKPATFILVNRKPEIQVKFHTKRRLRKMCV